MSNQLPNSIHDSSFEKEYHELFNTSKNNLLQSGQEWKGSGDYFVKFSLYQEQSTSTTSINTSNVSLNLDNHNA